MKKFFFLMAVAFLLKVTNGIAQVGINKDNSAPDLSSMLDVNSTNSGLLIPRLTQTQITSIPSPATGLLLYNTTTNLFNYYNGVMWNQVESTFVTVTSGTTHPGGGVSISVSSEAEADSSAILDVADTTKGILIPRSTIEAIISPTAGLIIYNTSNNSLNYYNGTQWITLCGTFTGVAGTPGTQELSGVAINTDGSLPHQSAILDVSSSSKGLLIPRLTTTQRNSILPVTGLTIYNSSLTAIEFYNGSGWYKLNGSYIPSPNAGTHVASVNQIIWKWSSVTGAIGYKWNTVNNYNSATDMGTATAKTETGLVCNTYYNRFVWAYNACGYSPSRTLSQSTLNGPPTAPLAGTHVPYYNKITWNWNPVPGATGYYWGTTNQLWNSVDLGTSTSYTETFLMCNTAQTSFVWAYSSCGISVSATLSSATLYGPPDPPTSGINVPSSTQIIWKWTPASGATGYKWNTTNDYASAINMGSSTSKTETGLACNTAYTRYIWAYSTCGNSISVVLHDSTRILAPTSGSHTPSQTQIIWKWNAASEATGYRWNTVNDTATAEDMGTMTSKTESGLHPDSIYTRYVWAYGLCGMSAACPLIQSTLPDPPGAPSQGIHVSFATEIIWNWNAVPGSTGYRWSTLPNYGSAINMGNSLSKIETGLEPDSVYTRYVWAYNSGGNSTATALCDTTTACTTDWDCGQPFTDQRDGKTYPTVLINTQCWMAQNLDIGIMIDSSFNQTGLFGTIEKYCYQGQLSNCNAYGGLYQWWEAMQFDTVPTTLTIKGICPNGWHLPKDQDWEILTTYLGGPEVAGGKMKEAGYAHWLEPNAGATNNSGFTGLGGGRRNPDTHFDDLMQRAYFWSSSSSANNFSWIRRLEYGYDNVYKVGEWNFSGFSVRCLKDENTKDTFSCGDSVIVNHIAGSVAPVTKTVTYHTVSGIFGEQCKCWITSNLGADHQAVTANDPSEASAGWYWQFNLKQGYKHDGSTVTPAWPTVYISELSNWQTANDPCTSELGGSWRIPTYSEWYNVDNAGNWINWYDPFNSDLKLHTAGFINDTNGSLLLKGELGEYWSSTQVFDYPYSPNGYDMCFNNEYEYCGICTTVKSLGMPLRCIRE